MNCQSFQSCTHPSNELLSIFSNMPSAHLDNIEPARKKALLSNADQGWPTHHRKSSKILELGVYQYLPPHRGDEPINLRVMQQTVCGAWSLRQRLSQCRQRIVVIATLLQQSEEFTISIWYDILSAAYLAVLSSAPPCSSNPPSNLS